MNTLSIGDALFTKTQQRLLAILYGRPEQSYYLNELVRLANVGKGSVNRELARMCSAGLLTMRKQGNQNHYQANAASPVFIELKSIVQKTFGIVDILKGALAPLLSQENMAFIYGSVAKGTEHASSDIDVMMVGEGLIYAEVMALLEPAELKLGRKINPTLYSPKEFSKRQKEGQNFLKKVMEQPKLWLSAKSEISDAVTFK